MGRLIALGIFALLLAGCSPFTQERTAFADLEPEVKELIVPDTAGWAGGEVCGDNLYGDCDGPEGFEEIRGTFWMKAAGVLEAEHFPQSSDLVLLRAETPGLLDQASDEMGMSLRGDNIEEALEGATAKDLELWLGTSEAYGYGYPFSATYLLAFDDKGRVTSIGHGSAKILSEPIARLSAAAGVSPKQYFLDLVFIEPPQRLLTATDPGELDEVFTPRRVIATSECVHLGQDGPVLVFPEGTVQERGYQEKGIDVIGDLSGLTELPLTGVIGKDGRVEVVGQSTTLTELGVHAFSRCPDEAIFVTEMRVIPAS